MLYRRSTDTLAAKAHLDMEPAIRGQPGVPK